MSSASTSNPISIDEVLNTLYQAVNTLTDRLDRLDSRLGALESKLSPSTATPKASTPARGPRAARSKSTKPKAPAPTTSSTTKTPAPTTIRSISTKDVQEKITVTLSIPDAQAGHLVGRAGTGLRQIHDISHAKLSVSPTVVSGSRVVTIRGSTREVGDATAAIGKRLARRRLRNPRSTKKKTNPASSPPVVEGTTKPPIPPSTPKAPMQVTPSGRPPLSASTLPPVEPSSGSSYAVPPPPSQASVERARETLRLAASITGRRPKGQ